MATAWTPNGDGAARIIQMIAEYLDPRANQREMLGRLEQCAGFPDFNNYLAHVLTSDEDAGRREDVRQSAGLLLKNNLKTSWTTTMSEEYSCLLYTSPSPRD